jgi:hypothetical protein
MACSRAVSIPSRGGSQGTLTVLLLLLTPCANAGLTAAAPDQTRGKKVRAMPLVPLARHTDRQCPAMAEALIELRRYPLARSPANVGFGRATEIAHPAPAAASGGHD